MSWNSGLPSQKNQCLSRSQFGPNGHEHRGYNRESWQAGGQFEKRRTSRVCADFNGLYVQVEAVRPLRLGGQA